MSDTGVMATGALTTGALVLDGRFRVERRIGAGGMGEVYLAEQVSLGRKVALKVLRHELSSQRGMMERFRREAQLLSVVEHPSVVRVFDFGQSEGLLCLVMEYVEGEALELTLRRGGFTVERAAPLLVQLAEGLAAIHKQGIVHRDLKPANVLLCVGARGEEARLLDFGIARLTGPTETEGGLTQAGMVLGTPEYLSPEQALGREVDFRSDLYSFGVLAYRLLAGRLPFPGPSARELLTQHITQLPEPLDSTAPHLAAHPALVRCVMQCLAKEPGDRPESAKWLAMQLRALGGAHGAILTPMQASTPAPVAAAGAAVSPHASAASPSPAPAHSVAELGTEDTRVSAPHDTEAQQTGASSPRPAPAVHALRTKLRALSTRTAGMVVVLLSLVAGFFAFDYFSLESRARRLLSNGAPEEALQLLEPALKEDASAGSLLRLKARALHAVERHADEISFLESAPGEALEGTEVELVRELAEDLGKSRKGEGVRAVLDRIPRKRRQSTLVKLALGPASYAQWGALRYLDGSGEKDAVDLVEAHVRALESPVCHIKAAAARRLGELGNTRAVEALDRLAKTPKKEGILFFDENCGQDEARSALRKLSPPTEQK